MTITTTQLVFKGVRALTAVAFAFAAIWVYYQ